MYELKVEGEFAAAHYLRNYEGQCENLHGHNWKVDVYLRSDVLDGVGMVMDFKKVRALVGEALSEFDHKCLNELDTFKTTNPTTENVSRILYGRIEVKLPPGITVSRVTCWESDHCAASYYND